MSNQIFHKAEILSTIRENKSELKRFGVQSLALTGSYAEGSEQLESDIDFLVQFTPGQKTYDNLYEVHTLLTALFEKKIDLLTPEGISPLILPYMEKIAIYERL